LHGSAGALGGLLIGCIGVLLPPVMFWGEWEIQTIASGAPLPHIWPKGALNVGWSRDRHWFMLMSATLVKPKPTNRAIFCTQRACIIPPHRHLWGRWQYTPFDSIRLR
jgi:hypothetical protein